MLDDRRILLIISGGIAAYKSLELIRRLRERGAAVRCVMTAAAQQFVTPLSVASLSEDKVYADLFSLTDESEMGHIRLSREADLVVVAPATRRSDRAHGGGAGRRSRRDDAARLGQAGADRADDELDDVGASGDPGQSRDAGRRAAWCGSGRVRASSPAARSGRAAWRSRGDRRRDRGHAGGTRPRGSPADARWSRAGRRASRSTRCAISRTIPRASRATRSRPHSPALGAETVLVSGPTQEPTPAGVTLVPVETAAEMLAACEAALPVDVAVMAAAVADWRVEQVAGQKLKKDGKGPPILRLAENPDILATHRPAQQRPAGAGHRLCRGNRRHRRQRPRQARSARLRLDPRQRRVARHRHFRRRPQHDPPRRCAMVSRTGRS